MRKERTSYAKRSDGVRTAFMLTDGHLEDLDAIADKWTRGNRSAAVRQLIEDQVGRDLSIKRRASRARRARTKRSGFRS